MTQSDDFAFLSREELLGGLPARRASTLLFAIESRTAHLVVRARQAAARLLTERSAAEQERAFLHALARGRDLPVGLTIQDLERYAPEWATLVPADPSVRAAVARLLGDKYAFTRGNVPQLRKALGLDDGAVAQAFERLHGRPLQAIFAPRNTWLQRLRWARARLAQSLETLPPFWTVFSLTLTETVGAGILALPIALAGVGALGGVVLLVVLGLVNMLTIAALAEAFTRNGSVRYGHAYFGGVVADYLGGSNAPALTRILLTTVSTLLLAFCIAVLLAYCIGVSTTLAYSSGIHAAVWAALQLAIILYFLRRETLNATIASALVIGAINIVLILGLLLLTLPHVSAANLLTIDVPFINGRPPETSLFGLIFGVILTAYFGHFSTGTCARLVLGRDPGGRALLWGNVAAMGVAALLYVCWVTAVNGAIPAAALLDQPGTALRPLATQVGPIVNVLGVLFVVLGMGMASIHYSLALSNQVREWLPTPASETRRSSASRSGLARIARTIALSRGGRFALGATPVVLIFAAAGWMLLTGQGSFAGPLGFLGVISLSVLGGIFPMLMLAASRRRGDYVPQTVLRFLGHPIVVLGVYLLFAANFFVHGLVIWDDPLQRLAALLVGAATIGLTGIMLRRGALTPRVVVELRVDHDEPSQATFNVTANGRAASADVRLRYAGREQQVRAVPGEERAFADLRSATFELPPTAARELKVRVHQLSPDASSAGLPALLEVHDGGRARTIDLERSDGQVVLPVSGEAQRLEIILAISKGER